MRNAVSRDPHSHLPQLLPFAAPVSFGILGVGIPLSMPWVRVPETAPFRGNEGPYAIAADVHAHDHTAVLDGHGCVPVQDAHSLCCAVLCGWMDGAGSRGCQKPMQASGSAWTSQPRPPPQPFWPTCASQWSSLHLNLQILNLPSIEIDWVPVADQDHGPHPHQVALSSQLLAVLRVRGHTLVSGSVCLESPVVRSHVLSWAGDSRLSTQGG